MRLVFKTEEVLDALRKNREEHEKTYREALAGYKEQTVERAAEFATAAAEYQAGETSHDDLNKFRYAATSLQRPTHYLDHYERAIAMLTVANTETVELDEQDFSRYIQDNWEWKQSFVGTSSTYIL